MRILLAAHAPWRATGYGMPVDLIVRMWRGLGHETVVMAIDTPGPGWLDYHGYPVVLMDQSRWGLDIVRQVVDHFEIKTIVSFFDPWVLPEPGYGRELSGAPWIAWLPVDQEPLPYDLGAVLEHADRVLSYSQWGLDVLRRRTTLGERAMVMPIPIDVEAFSPASLAERIGARGVFQLSLDTLVVGMVASNIAGDRKALAEQIEGFALFAERYGKERVRLLLNVEQHGAVDIPRLLTELGCAECAVFLSAFSKRYTLSEHRLLAMVYRAMDVLLHASAAEGFGMCMLEAMACGVPVIANATTSMPELLDGTGALVEQQIRTLSPHGGWWMRPTAAGVDAALHKFAADREAGRAEQGTALAETPRVTAEQYAPQALGGRWAEVLAGLEIRS